jgi:hypothetical protein
MVGKAKRKRAAKAKTKRGRGRPPGSPNKATADVRATIKLIAERNVLKFEQWLEGAAKKSPAKAADIFLRAIEYHIPKLARTEHTVPPGGAFPIMSLTATVSDEDAMRAYLKMVKGG